MSKDWQEKLRQLATKQKERGDREEFLTRENDKLSQQYSQLLKEFQDLGSSKTAQTQQAELEKKQCEADLAKSNKEGERLGKENEQLMTKLQSLCEGQARLSKQVQDLIAVRQELEARLQGSGKKVSGLVLMWGRNNSARGVVTRID